MDDSLEVPGVVAKPSPSDERREDDDAQSSGDEDEGPDWTKLPYVCDFATRSFLLVFQFPSV